MRYAEVAVFCRPPLHGIYDYCIEDDSVPVFIGQRVQVPFGKSSQYGVVTKIKASSHWQGEALKPIKVLLDDTPIIPNHLTQLLQWIIDYYHCNPIDAWRLVFPKASLKTDCTNVPDDLHTPTASLPKLNDQQQEIVSAIVHEPTMTPHLIEGVTGSGKTHIYAHLAHHALQQGKSALLLLPEIGLMTQNQYFFERYFSGQVHYYHSNLTDKAKLATWMAATSSKPKLFVGTRSALFLPFKNCGIYIMDEEHDESYHEQSTPYYHARNALLMRAKLSKAFSVLGSATPSLESLHNALKGKFFHHTLKQRATPFTPPTIECLDVRGSALKGGMSQEVIECINQHLEQDEQVLVFINRRGYAPIRMCYDCGSVQRCPDCGRPATFHKKSQKLICHRCQWSGLAAQSCQQCDSSNIQVLGFGTERITQALNRHFPNHNILRVDRDTIKTAGAWQQALEQMHSGKADILIGTKMMSKGHDLPHLGLVVILDADQGLLSSDYRAPERIAQQLEQVTGRAGRHRKGTVVIQSHCPENHMLQQWMNGGYSVLSRALLQQRKTIELPPFIHHALILCAGKVPEAARDFLDNIHRSLPQNAAVFISPVLPAPIEKSKGRWRFSIILESTDRTALHTILRQARQLLNSVKRPANTRAHIEVDPLSLN